MEKNIPKTTNAWVMYDWANSVFSLTITTAIFPIYYESVTGGKNGIIPMFGFSASNTTIYTYALSFAFLLTAFLNPLLSGIADIKGNKKSYMKFFAYLGSASCAGLYFFDNENVYLGITLFVLSLVGFAGSLVFYNAFLPEIATPDKFDKLSAKGYAMGYIGSVILLISNLILIEKYTLFGIENVQTATKICFLMVGIWWAGFAQIIFFIVPEQTNKNKDGSIWKGFNEIKRVRKEITRKPLIKRYLLGFFFYGMGTQTVMYVATLFGTKELQLKDSELILTVLIIQIVAVGGSYLFSLLSSKKGNINALLISIIVWIGVCIGAYYVKSSNGFYILAFLVGCVMGGIQSLSRSTFSKMLPKDRDHASYFSFYEMTDKIAIVLGTFSYGTIEQLTGSMRNSILALTAFFVIGLIFLSTIRKAQLSD